jgi:hypothetical protein
MGLYAIIGLGIVAIGFFIASRMRQDRSKWVASLILTVAPLALLAVLYFAAAGTGCSGGDCTGTMIGILLLGVMAVPVSAFGLGMLLQSALSWMVRETGGA